MMEGLSTTTGQELESVPFRCPVCSQAFGKSQHLKRHASIRMLPVSAHNGVGVTINLN